MDEQLDFGTPQLTEEQQLTLAEMKRRSNDRIRLYNPTSEDYYVLWDVAVSGGKFLIPAKTKDIGYGLGQAIQPRYIAENYVKGMTDKLLSARLLELRKRENQKRLGSGQATMNKWEEEYQFDLNNKISTPELRAPIIKVLWLGIEEEFGANTPAVTEVKKDNRSVDEIVLAGLNKPFNKNAALPELPSLDGLEDTPSAASAPSQPQQGITINPMADLPNL